MSLAYALVQESGWLREARLEEYQTLIKGASNKIIWLKKSLPTFCNLWIFTEKNYRNLIKPMTTKYQQILPATIFKACKSERGRFSHKPPNDILTHPADDLLTSSDRMKNWKFVPYSSHKSLKEGGKKAVTDTKLLHTESDSALHSLC